MANGKWADKEDLPFSLLTDDEWALRLKLGHPEKVNKPVNRITYVIDQQGVVQHIVWYKGRADVKEHVSQALETVKRLKFQATGTRSA